MERKNSLKTNHNFTLREIEKSDQDFLFEMLRQSIFVAPNSPPLDNNIINLPEIRKYVENWGKEGDFGYVAVDNKSGARIGAIWLRFFDFNNKGYGYISDNIPETGIAVDYTKRGIGIGTALIKELLKRTKESLKVLSLSVQQNNPAVKLYEKFGFIEHSKAGNSIIMRYDRKL